MVAIAATLSIPANAQFVTTEEQKAPEASTAITVKKDYTNSFVKGSDLYVSYSSDSKVFGLSFLTDLNQYLYMGLGFAADIDGFDTYNSALYFGVGKRYRIGKYLLVQGKIGPYAGLLGYTAYEYDKKGRKSEKEKMKFAYGVNANIAAGVRLWDTKKGNSVFLTAGYYLDAYEFKTKDLFKNGSWGIGFTTILK